MFNLLSGDEEQRVFVQIQLLAFNSFGADSTAEINLF